MESHKKIEEFITQYPIYQYSFLSPGEVEFSERVRMICKKECSRYGNSWSCPPAVGTVEQCKSKCMEYPDALFFSTVAEVDDIMDMHSTLKTRKEHEELTEKIESYLREQGYGCLTLSTESCDLCEKCTYPKHPCAHPQKMHPCIESHGILVTNLAEKHCMDYYMGEKYVLWYTLIFFKRV